MLEELQSLSENNKKRVLVITTVIIMIIVIGIWISYFNSIIVGTAQQVAMRATSSAAEAPTFTAPAASPQASGPSLWQNIKNGFGFVANIFRQPSQYNVQPQSN